jgi:hypothetical protein
MFKPSPARVAQKRTPELIENTECPLLRRGAGAHAGRVGTRAAATRRPPRLQELP